MTSNFEKEYLPEWCGRCDKQGVYFVNDANAPHLVRHTRCGYEALSAWCPNCQIGYAFPIEPYAHPKDWTCPKCHKMYSLPASIFNEPIHLYVEDELPDDVRERVLPVTNKVLQKTFSQLVAWGERFSHLLVVVVGIFLLGYTSYQFIIDSSPNPQIEAQGQVVGYGCADSTPHSLNDCYIKYSIITFEDARGQWHTINNPDENLSGTVTVRYSFITLFGSIDLGIRVDRGDAVWINQIVDITLGCISLVMVLAIMIHYLSRKKKVSKQGGIHY